MSGNDWNGLGRDVKDIVENAINTGDFGALNRDLGVTLENAIGNMARNFRKPGANDYQTCDQNDGRHKSSYRPYGNDRSYGNTSRRIQKAREEFALFINTRKMKGLSIAALITGLILAVSSGFVLGIMGIVALLWEYAVKPFIVTAAVLVPIGCAGVVAAVWGNRTRKQVARFRAYVKTLNGKAYGNIKDLARSVGKSEKFVVKDLSKMIEKRMFLEGHLDENNICLMASNDAYEQYMETQKNMERMKEQAAREPKRQLSEEARKTIEAGNRYIEEIRRSNEAIPGIEISNKMYHLENVIRRIFQRVEEHPELIDDLHKFMDYYLPTTMKLLNAYEELDKQELTGEHVQSAKTEIENTLDTINDAFENLLDSFYKETAWDVSSDISVLKTMLAQEGLTGKKDFKEKGN